MYVSGAGLCRTRSFLLYRSPMRMTASGQREARPSFRGGCLDPFSSFAKRLLALLPVLLVCVSGAFATTTKHASKPVAKASSAKTSARTASHATHAQAKATTKTVKTTSGTSSHSSSSSKRVSAKGKGRRSTQPKQTARSRGQQGIDADRARTIQEALIRAKYMDGEPSGVWDQKTKDALTRFQSDNGWQSKVVPDSRALIKLGLGPNHDNVLNPETSGLTAAPAVGISPAQLQPGSSNAN